MVLRKSLMAALVIGLGLVLGMLVTQSGDSDVKFGDTQELRAQGAIAQKKCPPRGTYGNPLPPSCADQDNDGINDAKDKDDDNDGIKDAKDKDRDGDGVPDKQDKDTDNDGKNDKKDKDVDGDGVKNGKDKDDDGDGVNDKNDKDHPKNK